jgi:prepilin-type N-terminal cleavage/methylation domain-containing protein
MLWRNSQKGFTFIELAIVVVIISIGAALAVPKFNGVITKLKFKSTGRNIVSILRLARSSAIAMKAQFGVYFDVGNNQYIYYKDIENLSSYSYDSGDSVISSVDLPVNLSFGYSCFNNNTVVFLPDGSASTSGNVDLYPAEGSGYLMVDVLASTGRVKLYKQDYDYN